jgi:hypothetical protein
MLGRAMGDSSESLCKIYKDRERTRVSLVRGSNCECNTKTIPSFVFAFPFVCGHLLTPFEFVGFNDSKDC